jgi:hypothetical protein
LSGGGLATGVFSGPINVNKNIALENVQFVALGTTHLPLNTGVLVIGGSFSTGLNVSVDGAYLPVNVCYANSNGTIWWNNLHCTNWLGSGPQTTLTNVTTLAEAYFTASIAGCGGSAPFTCTMAVTAINSNGLLGGSFSGGSGYAGGDKIALSQTGGTQRAGAVVKIATVTGTGAVSSYTVVTGGVFTTNPTSFTQSSTSGGGTGFSISAPAFTPNVIQPGQGLSDSGVNIPDGTTVAQFGSGAGAGSGGIGNYTVYNANTSPAVSSEAMRTYGLDLGISVANGGSLADIGLISHGNAVAGISDRTFIVAYLADSATTGRLTLNKAPTTTFSGTTLNFYQDSNGFFLTSAAGVQMLNLNIQQADYFDTLGNQYGCAVYSNSLGGSTFTKSAFFFGAANICLGPTAANNQFRQITTLNNYDDGAACCEINLPAIIAMDGVKNTILNDIEAYGQIQVFDLTGSQPESVVLTALADDVDTGQAENTPNNNVWFYTEGGTGSSANGVIASPFASNFQNTASGQPNQITFTTGGGGFWQEFTPGQIALLSQGLNVTLPNFMQQPMAFPRGINLMTSGLYGWECPLNLGATNITAATTLTEGYTGSCLTIAGSGSYTITLDPSLGFNVSQAYNRTSFYIPKMVLSTSATVTLAPGSGATLYVGGSSTAGAVLSQNVPYSLWCPRNVGGAAGICYLGSP